MYMYICILDVHAYIHVYGINRQCLKLVVRPAPGAYISTAGCKLDDNDKLMHILCIVFPSPFKYEN